MKKNLFKKIAGCFAAIAAVAMVAVSASALNAPPTASPNDQVSADGYKATFEYGRGYAKLTYNESTARSCYAYVAVYSNTTGSMVTSDYDSGVLSNGGSVEARANGYTSSAYNYTCMGAIRYNTSSSSTSVWSITKTVS